MTRFRVGFALGVPVGMVLLAAAVLGLVEFTFRKGER